MKINFILNGVDTPVDAPSTTRLSTLLREDFNIRSLKNGCNRGQCGCCSVLKDKRIVPSCFIPLFALNGCEIITIEGFKIFKEYNILNSVIRELNIEMCEYCRGARLLSIYAFCENKKILQLISDEMILEALSGTRCNCIDMWTLVNLVRGYLEKKKVKKNVIKR